MADQDRRYIYPKKGATVRDPDMSMQPIPATGQEVIWNLRWQQLLHFGDIVEETAERKERRLASEAEERQKATGEEAVAHPPPPPPQPEIPEAPAPVVAEKSEGKAGKKG